MVWKVACANHLQLILYDDEAQIPDPKVRLKREIDKTIVKGLILADKEGLLPNGWIKELLDSAKVVGSSHSLGADVGMFKTMRSAPWGIKNCGKPFAFKLQATRLSIASTRISKHN